MIASAMQPWQIHLGARTILILPQDDAEMFVSMFSTKLEQLQKTSPKEVKEGSPDSEDRTWSKQSCLSPRLNQGLAYSSSEEGSASDIGIFLGDVTNPIVNCLRNSLGLLTLHQPVAACGRSR